MEYIVLYTLDMIGSIIKTTVKLYFSNNPLNFSPVCFGDTCCSVLRTLEANTSLCYFVRKDTEWQQVYLLKVQPNKLTSIQGRNDEKLYI